MKWLLIISFLLIHPEMEGQNKRFPPDTIVAPSELLKSFADTSVLIKRHQHNSKALFYLDSILFVDLPLIDVSKIENMRMENGYDSTYKRKGKVYITTKKDSKLDLLTANGIKIKYALQIDNKPSLWMVDNNIIERLAYFRIDSSYLYKIEVQEIPEIDSLGKPISSLTIIKIYTRTKGNIDRFSSDIKIRGSISD